MKRKQPITSHDAYNSMKGEPIENHHAKIIEALTVLGKANYEEITKHAGFKNANAASRRLKEMELKNLIIKTGETKPTSSGRKAFLYQLVIPPKKESYSMLGIQPTLF